MKCEECGDYRFKSAREASPAPQPEPTSLHDNWCDFPKCLGPCNCRLAEQPAPPAGAREAIMQALDPVSQWDAGYEAGKVVGAASERARADEAERELASMTITWNSALKGEDDALRTCRAQHKQLESLRSELREAKQELAKVYGAIPLAVLREYIPGWPEAVSRKEDKAQ